MRRKTHQRRTKDVRQNADGSYSYEGEYLRFSDQTPRRASLARLGALLAVAAVATVLPGFLPVAALTGQLAVTMSYIAQVVAVVSCAWGTARLARAPERFRTYLREETADRLPGRAVVAAFFAGAALVGDVALTATGVVALTGFELGFFACEVVAAASMVLFWQAAKRLAFERA